VIEAPIGLLFISSVLLWNFKICFGHGVENSAVFHCPSPSMEDYLRASPPLHCEPKIKFPRGRTQLEIPKDNFCEFRAKIYNSTGTIKLQTQSSGITSILEDSDLFISVLFSLTRKVLASRMRSRRSIEIAFDMDSVAGKNGSCDSDSESSNSELGVLFAFTVATVMLRKMVTSKARRKHGESTAVRAPEKRQTGTLGARLAQGKLTEITLHGPQNLVYQNSPKESLNAGMEYHAR
jgi:hypothetical protein